MLNQAHITVINRMRGEESTTIPTITNPFTRNLNPALAVANITADATDTEAEVAGVSAENLRSNLSGQDGEVLSAQDEKGNWSIINVLLTIAAALASLVMMLGLIGSNRSSRKLHSRIFSIVPAALAIAALFMIEDFTGNMIWFNVYTWLMLIFVLVQSFIIGTSKNADEE